MSSSNSTLAGRGSHQLVSEPADPWSHGCPQSSPYFLPQQSWLCPTPPPPPPQSLDSVFESSKEVRREGSSGHGESGGTTTARERASTVEDRFHSIEGTMEALAGTVLDLGDRFAKFERMLEEITRSRRDPESPNPNLHHPMAAPSPFSSVQMPHSQAHAERIKVLTVAYQKYKERRDSKAFEVPLQKHNDELLNVSSTFPSSLLSASANDSNRSGSCREDIDKHSYNSSRSVEDSMFPQVLHFSKGLAKETANFTFQVFIMNHPGQMGSGYVHVLDCPISHIAVKVAEVVTKIDRQSEKEIEEELIDPVRVWDPGIELQFQLVRSSVTGTMSHKLCF